MGLLWLGVELVAAPTPLAFGGEFGGPGKKEGLISINKSINDKIKPCIYTRFDNYFGDKQR